MYPLWLGRDRSRAGLQYKGDFITGLTYMQSFAIHRMGTNGHTLAVQVPFGEKKRWTSYPTPHDCYMDIPRDTPLFEIINERYRPHWFADLERAMTDDQDTLTLGREIVEIVKLCFLHVLALVVGPDACHLTGVFLAADASRPKTNELGLTLWYFSCHLIHTGVVFDSIHSTFL